MLYPYGAALRLTFDLRLQLTFRPCLRNSFQFPAAASLRRCPPANPRLSPQTNLPALPADPTSDSSVAAFSGCAFRLTLDSRLRPAFQFRLLVYLFGLRLGFNLPATFQSFPLAFASV